MSATSDNVKSIKEISPAAAVHSKLGLGVFSLEFQQHVATESERLKNKSPSIKDKKLFKKVQKLWDETHPVPPEDGKAKVAVLQAGPAQSIGGPTPSRTPLAQPAPASDEPEAPKTKTRKKKDRKKQKHAEMKAAAEKKQETAAAAAVEADQDELADDTTASAVVSKLQARLVRSSPTVEAPSEADGAKAMDVEPTEETNGETSTASGSASTDAQGLQNQPATITSARIEELPSSESSSSSEDA